MRKEIHYLYKRLSNKIIESLKTGNIGKIRMLNPLVMMRFYLLYCSPENIDSEKEAATGVQKEKINYTSNNKNEKKDLKAFLILNKRNLIKKFKNEKLID